MCACAHHMHMQQMYKEPFGWVQAVSTFVSTVGVVLVAQPAFIFGSPPHEATADTKGGGSGTSAQQSVSIGFAFAAAFAAAFAFLAIRRVKVRQLALACRG